MRHLPTSNVLRGNGLVQSIVNGIHPEIKEAGDIRPD